MLRIWLLYNLALTLLIFGTSLTSAQTLSQFLLPLLLLPLCYYLGKELLKKTKRKKLIDPAIFVSNIPTR